MIVRHDDAGGTVGDGVGEDFAWVNQAGGERADGDDALGDQAISAVKRQTNKIFLFFVADVG